MFEKINRHGGVVERCLYKYQIVIISKNKQIGKFLTEIFKGVRQLGML